jgi:hypothetical protein
MSRNNGKLDPIKINILKELNYLNHWLKSRNPKKMTLRVNDLLDEAKLIKTSSHHLKPSLQQHLYDKANYINDTIHQKLENTKVIDNFIKIIKPDFKDNNQVLKSIDDVKKMHDVYYKDLIKAKDLIAKI